MDGSIDLWIAVKEQRPKTSRLKCRRSLKMITSTYFGHVRLRLLTCTLLQSLCAAELQQLLLLQQRADLPISA
jgi:hypothetical protein